MAILPLELLKARQWSRALFTTYSLSLSFFEAVILDALVRSRSKQAVILADTDGVRTALSDQGAGRVGKDYEVEPIFVDHGVFHPKITLLSTEGDAHLLVGSGNLTFNGWGGNLEVIEHLSSQFAASALNQAAEFFELLSSKQSTTNSVKRHCEIAASDLRRSTLGKTDSGEFRFLHSLEHSLLSQMSALCDELGGAKSLVVASPYWDNGSAIDKLRAELSVSEVKVHNHLGGTVEGQFGSNWPTSPKSQIAPIRLKHLATDEHNSQKLHAKIYEAVCKRGRIVFSGSANATMAGLRGKNIEALIARVQRTSIHHWTFSPSAAPDIVSGQSLNEESIDEIGVLRASVDGDRLSGEVLCPKIVGKAVVHHITSDGPILLGDVHVDDDSRFSLKAPTLEMDAITGQRIVIEIVQGKIRVQGFVSVASFSELTRRAGAIASKLFSVLAGTETPADIAAVMTWIADNPDRVEPLAEFATRGRSTESNEQYNLIDPRRIEGQIDPEILADRGEHDNSGATWQRFMHSLFRAFQRNRGPFETPESRERDNDEDPDDQISSRDDPSVLRLLGEFDKLFSVLTENGRLRDCIVAFDLAQYVSSRARPPSYKIEQWLHRLVELGARFELGDRKIDFVSACMLLLSLTQKDTSDYMVARSRIQRLNFLIQESAPDFSAVSGYAESLAVSVEASDWGQVFIVRTYSEQVQNFLEALQGHVNNGSYAALVELDRYGRDIERLLASTNPMSQILIAKQGNDYCPRCFRTLPKIESQALRTYWLAKASNCCGRLLLCVARP